MTERIIAGAAATGKRLDKVQAFAVPRWLGSVGLLVGTYAAVMIAAALWMPHEWDWQILRWLGSSVAPTFSPEVSIVNVDWSPTDFAKDRRRIANFLDGLSRSNQRPGAVILDVEFGPCQSSPCGAPMTSADEALGRSIQNATRYFPVYATEEPQVGRGDVVVGPLDPKTRGSTPSSAAPLRPASSAFPTLKAFSTASATPTFHSTTPRERRSGPRTYGRW